MNQTWEQLPPEQQAERRAPEGKVWQCGACGKVSEDLYGIIGRHSPYWDESCMLNSGLVEANAPGVRSLP